MSPLPKSAWKLMGNSTQPHDQPPHSPFYKLTLQSGGSPRERPQPELPMFESSSAKGISPLHFLKLFSVLSFFSPSYHHLYHFSLPHTARDDWKMVLPSLHTAAHTQLPLMNAEGKEVALCQPGEGTSSSRSTGGERQLCQRTLVLGCS